LYLVVPGAMNPILKKNSLEERKSRSGKGGFFVSLFTVCDGLF
jgi:hypothetical protein